MTKRIGMVHRVQYVNVYSHRLVPSKVFVLRHMLERHIWRRHRENLKGQ